MRTHKPMFFVFAGNNGSGKSTFRNLIIDKMGIDINIDPDAIPRKIDPENPEHHIPTEDILRRNETSFENLYKYCSIIDNLILIDNSKDNGEIIMEINNGNISFKSNQLTQWSLPIWRKYNMS